MINQHKVRMMARTRVFESNEGKAALKLKEHCEDMPFWKSLGSSALCGVLLFVLLGILFLAVFPEWAKSMLEQMGRVLVGGTVVLSVIVFSVLYSLISNFVFKYIYRKKRSSLCGYRAEVQRLEKIKREQDL